MAISHVKVSRIINKALDDANKDLSITTVAQAIKSAWTDVNAKRLFGDCGEDLAAAEHYLYCRFIVSNHSPAMVPLLSLASDLYDITKMLGIGFQESDCPQSPPSKADQQWRIKGMQDGIQDFIGNTRLHHLGAPVAPIFGPPTHR